PYRAAFAQIICVADTDREAEELYSEHVRYFFNRCLHVYPGFADPPGYRTIKTLKAGALSQLTQDALAKFPTLTWKQLIDDRYVIAGSPETVRQQMEEMIKGLRIGHVFCLFHNGNMPDWKTRHSSKLFAEQVMPKLRDLWPEWRADDRWWPKPMADRLEPERPHPVGHSMGGMIAAEMAALAPNDLAKLVLVSAAGLWIPEHPIPDLFALLPHEYAQVLFHDPAAGAALLTGGLDFTNLQALAD